MPPLISSPTAQFVSPAATNAGATGAAQAQNAGNESPFQVILTATTQAQQSPTPGAATATDIPAVTDLETDDADATLAQDASLVGLLAFVTQILAPPENAAVAQATGQTVPAAQVSGDATVAADARSRADQLLLDRGNGFLPGTGNATALTNPAAPTPIAANAPAAPDLANAAPANGAVPIVTTADTTTPAAVVARVSTPAGARVAPNIPAQAPILPNAIPGISIPTDLSVTAPPVGEPTPAIPVTGLPATQLGDRPATAGERLVADAEAGARLATPPKSVAFANALVQEVTAPTPTAPTPVSAAAVGAAAINTTEAVQPAVPGTANVVSEPKPVVIAGRILVEDVRTVRPAPTGTELNFGRLVASNTPPVEPLARTDDSRPTDDATTAPIVGSQSAIPTAAPRGTTEVAAVKATPAAQIADTIVTHARVIERDGGVEFQMRLDPPELGPLQIRLVTRGTEVHGHVVAASDAVRGMIESQLPELRQRLEAAGVSVERFDVSTDPGTGGNRNPYRDDTPNDLAPRPLAAPAIPPQARIGRPDSGSLDVTV